MRFVWDARKNRRNVAKHGVAFETAARIFEGPRLTMIDDREDYGELREVSIGLVDGLVALIVVHSESDGAVRIISARRALKRERKRYEEAIRQAT